MKHESARVPRAGLSLAEERDLFRTQWEEISDIASALKVERDALLAQVTALGSALARLVSYENAMGGDPVSECVPEPTDGMWENAWDEARRAVTALESQRQSAPGEPS